ncbi:MAG: hypothetical protein QOE76_3632 [Frankiales bacterium]|nr:hypothetical protein [Frankiales bacterium]
MDPGEVRKVATSLDAQAQAVAAVVGTIDGLVSHLQQCWAGHDAMIFADWWHSQHRPALQGAHDAIAGLAQSARTNAAAQDQASSGGAAGDHAAPILASTRSIAYSAAALATPVELAAANKLALSTIAHAGKHFPQAAEQISAWQARIDSGNASSADVEAFRRYVILVNLANLQRGTVKDAADLAVDSMKDATSAEIAAVVGLATLGHGAVTAKAGGMAAEKTGEQLTAKALEKGLAKGGLDGLGDHLQGWGQDKVMDAVTRGRPDQILSAYDKSADQYLASVAAQGTPAAGLHKVNVQNVFASSAGILDGRLEEQQYDSLSADSTQLITGDGSVVQDVESGVLGAIPGFGTAFGAAQATASGIHGGMEMQVAVGSLNVACVSSLQNLQSTAQELELTPR